jgi:hypothetical protein
LLPNVFIINDEFFVSWNLAHNRRLLAESDRNPERNEVQHNWLLKLLTDEEAEDAIQTALNSLGCRRALWALPLVHFLRRDLE